MLYSGFMVIAVYYWTAFIAKLITYFIVWVPLLYQRLTLLCWELVVLMTWIDDLDVWMTLQEYCTFVHTWIYSYGICYDGLSVTEIGPLLGECFPLNVWKCGLIFFAALMYFDISSDIFSKWFSTALVCIVIVLEKLFLIHRFYDDPGILGWLIVISPRCSDVIMLLLHMYSRVFLYYPVVPVYEDSMSFWIVLVFFCTVTLLARLPGRKICPCGGFCLRELSLITLLLYDPSNVTYVVPRHGQGHSWSVVMVSW